MEKKDFGVVAEVVEDMEDMEHTEDTEEYMEDAEIIFIENRLFILLGGIVGGIIFGIVVKTDV
jgi:3,4-dihydroxy-2-butanone 4-phosphate synthase